jgi:hypothetical protein
MVDGRSEHSYVCVCVYIYIYILREGASTHIYVECALVLSNSLKNK